MINIFINFWLHKSIANGPKAPIKCRITVYGVPKDFSISEKVEPAKWNQEAQKVKGENDEAKRINTKIHRLKTEIDRIVRNMEDNNVIVSSAGIVFELKRKPEAAPKLLALYKKLVIDRNVLLGKKKGYITSLKVTTTLFNDFLQYHYHKDDINISECTEEFWRNIQEDMLTERPRKRLKNDKIITLTYKMTNNYILKKIRSMSPVIKYALNKGWIKEGIADYVFVKRTKSIYKYLEQEEVNILKNIQFSPLDYSIDTTNLLKVAEIPFNTLHNKIYIEETTLNNFNICRDIALAQIECGASFEAIAKFTDDNILVTPEGIEILQYTRAKTEENGGILSRQVVSKELKRLIEKYKDCDHRKVTGKLFPVPSLQYYNRTLKKIQILCKIVKKLTTHVFRHTFGTLKSEEGWGIEDIAVMMGHSDLRATRIYSRVTNKRLINKSEELYPEKSKIV